MSTVGVGARPGLRRGYLSAGGARAILLPVAAMLVWPLLACGGTRHVRTLDANATWNSDGSEVLLIRLRYSTTRPEEPFFNAPSSRDWEIIAIRATADLKPVAELARWRNESNDGGGLPYQPMFWLERRSRLVYVESRSAYLFDLAARRRMLLRPGDEVLQEHVGPELVENAFARSPVPAPDGATVAVYFTATFFEKGPLSPQRFIHLVSFFDTTSGKHIRTVRIPFRDDTRDPFLVPPVPGMPHYWRFLWSQDSSAVFSMDSRQAFRIAVRSGSPSAVGQVPARALPSMGGPVSPRGEYLHTVETDSPKSLRVAKRSIPGWVPFERLRTRPLSKVRYARP